MLYSVGKVLRITCIRRIYYIRWMHYIPFAASSAAGCCSLLSQLHPAMAYPNTQCDPAHRRAAPPFPLLCACEYYRLTQTSLLSSFLNYSSLNIVLTQLRWR